jgi:hypothetical protein
MNTLKSSNRDNCCPTNERLYSDSSENNLNMKQMSIYAKDLKKKFNAGLREISKDSKANLEIDEDKLDIGVNEVSLKRNNSFDNDKNEDVEVSHVGHLSRSDTCRKKLYEGINVDQRQECVTNSISEFEQDQEIVASLSAENQPELTDQYPLRTGAIKAKDSIESFVSDHVDVVPLQTLQNVEEINYEEHDLSSVNSVNGLDGIAGIKTSYFFADIESDSDRKEVVSVMNTLLEKLEECTADRTENKSTAPINDEIQQETCSSEEEFRNYCFRSRFVALLSFATVLAFGLFILKKIMISPEGVNFDLPCSDKSAMSDCKSCNSIEATSERINESSIQSKKHIPNSSSSLIPKLRILSYKSISGVNTNPNMEDSYRELERTDDNMDSTYERGIIWDIFQPFTSIFKRIISLLGKTLSRPLSFFKQRLSSKNR